jgi:DNA-directed RNA polymerase specialized sigma24 family protein
MTDEEIREQFENKVRAGIFRPVIRHITGSDPEERLAEAVAMTFELYQAKARQGVLLDDALLVHHARLRAIDLGRQLVRGGQRLRDAMDPRNYTRGRLKLLRVDGLPDEDGDLQGEEQGDLVIGMADGLAQDPTVRLISAIDLASWASSLPPTDRAVLAARYQGCTLQETAEAMDSSISAVFARLKRLGGELAQRAGVTIRPKPRKRRAPRLGPELACTA